MSLRKALYLLLCLSVYVISLLAFFPKKKANDYSLVSKDDYMGYLYYKTSDFYEKYDADSILLKDISFVFDMGVSIDLTSINYEFMIIRQGVIYRGPFEENITVKNVPFIMDNNLTRINTISFALLDHTNKQVYTWYKKNLIICTSTTNIILDLKMMESFRLPVLCLLGNFRIYIS